MQQVTRAVDSVQKQEHRHLLSEGNECWKKTKSLWLTSQENVSEKKRDQFKSLKELNLQPAELGRSRSACETCGVTAERPGENDSSTSGTAEPDDHSWLP